MSESNMEQARFNMIEQQIRPWNVYSLDVLDTFNAIHREAFVPDKYRGLAFSDVKLPLAEGQFMMEPKVEGRVLQHLAIKPTDNVLEVGTGSGYLTACLAKLAASVTTVEIHKSLLESAKKHFTAQHIDTSNVTFVQGDAAKGWSDKEKFDAIAITASMPVYHNGFEKCLTIGGRLFVIHGEMPLMQASLITRLKEDLWETENLFEIDLPALVGAKSANKFKL